jgi:hypothetical protein
LLRLGKITSKSLSALSSMAGFSASTGRRLLPYATLPSPLIACSSSPRAGPAVPESPAKRRVNLAVGTGIEKPDLKSEHARRPLHVCQYLFGGSSGRVYENGDRGGFGQQIMEKSQLLCHRPRLTLIDDDACNVASRPIDADRDSLPNSCIVPDETHDWHRGARRLNCTYDRGAIADCNNDGHPPPDQIGDQSGQPIKLGIEITVLDRDVLAFNETLRIQRSMEHGQHKRIRGGRAV